MLFAVILTACVFASCSKDDDDNSGAASSLTMNGEAIKVKSIEGEYDPSTSFRAFTFWVMMPALLILECTFKVLYLPS